MAQHSSIEQPDRDRRRGTWIGAGTLIGVLLAAVAIALAIGGGPRWPEAVAFAAGVSLFAAAAGWLVARLAPRDPALAVAANLGAVTLRIVAPLVALGWLNSGGKGLLSAGAGGLLVAFYLTLLATDIVLNIMMAPQAPLSLKR